MSAAVAQLPVDAQIGQLRAEAVAQMERARSCARQSDVDGEKEARGHAADLQRRIQELEQHQPK